MRHYTSQRACYSLHDDSLPSIARGISFSSVIACRTVKDTIAAILELDAFPCCQMSYIPTGG